MSLRSRMAIGLGAITALVIGLVGVGAYVVTAHRLNSQIDQSLRESASEFAGPVSAEVDRDQDHTGFTRPTECPPAGQFEPAAAAQLVVADGTATACIEGGVTIPVDRADLVLARRSADEIRLRTVVIRGRSYRVLTAPRGNGSALQIARSLGEVDDVLASMQRWMFGLGLAGVGAAVLLGFALAQRTARPVERLRDTAERIAATQDLAVDVPVGGPSEIASLGRSFTTMVDALSESRTAQQRLVRDSSHELRTPLTSLRTNAELLTRGAALTPEQQRSVVEAIGFEVEELTDLVSELVELAAEGGVDDEPVESVDLAALAREVAQRTVRRTGREVLVTATEPTVLELRPQMIARAIANLVENAVKYSEGPVEIVVDGARLEVRDVGPGIPDADRPFVFDRFYRSTEARTAPGSGLGLAIVQRAVQRHGGTVWAGDRDGGPGAAVGFSIPGGPVSGS